MLKKDAMVGLLCLVGSVVLYSTLGLIDEERAVYFPKTVIIIMGILSALLMIQGALKPVGNKDKNTGYPWGRFAVLFSTIVVYLLVCESLGFYLSSFLFFLAVAFVMGGRRQIDAAAAASRAGVAAVFVGVLFLLFTVLLEVQIPRGILY